MLEDVSCTFISDERLIVAPADIAERVIAAGWMRFLAAGDRNLGTQVNLIARWLSKPADDVRKNIITEQLVPITKASAKLKSLSAIHGLSAFPLHTDGAHLIEPPRFIILACIDPGSSPAPTILVRFHDLQIVGPARKRLEGAIYVVRNGRRSFYSSVYDPTRPFIRFDQGCMEPLDDDARCASETIASRAARGKLTAIHWRKRDMLIFDNWRVLHGRGFAGSIASRDRRMLRASVR